MIEIYSSVDKTLIPNMPQVVFNGRIVVVNTEVEAYKAICSLKTCDIVGFDTETRPSFKRSVINNTALLQLSSDDTAFLFRLNIIGMPDFICDYLADSSALKVGISLKDDFNSLMHRKRINPKGFVDLQDYAGQMGIEEKGLQRMYALLFGQRISKGQRLSNWEAEILSEGQCCYAAIDAWACTVIYRYLNRLRQTGEFRIIKVHAEEGNTEER